MFILSYDPTIFPSFYLFLAKICLQFLTALLKYYFHLIKFTMLSIHFIKFGKAYSHATVNTINFQNIFTTPKSYLTPSVSQFPLPSQATLIVLPFLEFHIKRTHSMQSFTSGFFHLACFWDPSMLLRANKLFHLVASIIPLFMYHVDFYIPPLSIYQFMDLLFYYNE